MNTRTERIATPHRSPRQAFGGNRNNQFLKLHHNEKKILARSPLTRSHSSGGVPTAGEALDRGDTVATEHVFITALVLAYVKI